MGIKGLRSRLAVWGTLAILALAVPASGAGASLTRLRLAFASTGQLAEVPLFVAGERLRARGVALEPIQLTAPSLVVTAVVRGDVEIGHGALSSTGAAIQQGARIRHFLESYRSDLLIYARLSVTGCGELAGRRIAVQGIPSLSAAMARYWILERCPSVNPEFITIQGSDTRAAALMAGQIDVAVVSMANALQVDRLRPGQFHRLANFNKDLAWLLSFMLYANHATLSSNRDILKTFTREVILTHRLALRDPDLMAAAAAKYTRVLDPTSLPQIARAYAANGVWSSDGGISPNAMARTIRFFEELESLKPGLTADQAGDFTLVREVLRELDRRP